MNVTTRRVSRRRWRIWIPLLAYLAVSLPVFGHEVKMPAATDLHSHGVTQDQIESLAETLRQAVQQELIAGCSFLVAHKGETVFRKAFGYADLESKRLFTTDELCMIASVSKPFLATVLMVLVEQGKVKLEDPVEKYLPEFQGIRVEGSQSPARPMTVRHLLSHTGGFWGNKGITPKKLDLIRNFKRPLAEAVKGIAQYDLVYEPGTKFLYSYSREGGWMAWYHGQVIPPRAGRYRFWGYADNHLLVAILEFRELTIPLCPA